MNRDTSQAQNIYTKSTVNPNLNYIPNQPEIKFSFRQQMQPHIINQIRPHLPPTQHQPYQRYSHDIPHSNQPHSNNAFVHLRNQISNLRSQFSKLIQKDNSKITEKISYQSRDRQKKDTSPNKLTNRMPTYSTIGFYNKFSQTEKKSPFEAKQKIDQNYTFKTKISQQQKSVIIDKTSPDMKKDFVSIDNGKILAKSFLDKKQTVVVPSQGSKIQNLQKQIIRLNEIKQRVQQEFQKKNKEFNMKEQDLQKKLRQKIEQIQNLKTIIEQLNISLSLKNSLVQKFQLEMAKIKKQNQCLLNKIKEEGENLKKKEQQYQKKLITNQESNHKKINEVVNDYKLLEAQFSQQKYQKNQIRNKLVQLSKQYEESRVLNKKLQVQIHQLKEQLHRISGQKAKQTLQAKMRTQTQSQLKVQDFTNKETNLSAQILTKLKSYQQQNLDLKKRVQSFKKSIQQLNNSHNLSREKYAQAKQQLKILREESVIKEALINSLYRDIALLDNQLRQIPIYKSIISANNKFIQDLNHKIIHLQLQKLSNKYVAQNEL